MLHLATKAISSIDKIDNQLLINKDYEIQNMKIGNVPSGQDVKQIFHIRFKQPQKIPDTVYYYTVFETSTDWAITKLAQKVLTEYLDNKEIQKLASRNYSRWGALHLRGNRE